MRKAKKRFTVDKKVRSRYPLFAFLAILLLLAAGAFFLLRDTDESKKTSDNTAQTSNIPSDEDQPASDNKTSTPSPDTGPKDQTDSTTPTGSPPITPFGSFVSNHQPELESSWELNRMQSVCNTTAGASCVVSFTKGDVRKSLPSQKTDKEGAAYWSWTLQEVGLTEGTWKITASATLNGQTSNASDPINLEVKQ